MMERVERRMKRLLLASIGAAAVTHEQSEGLMRELIARGEAVIDRSGIRNECLHCDSVEDEPKTDNTSGEDRDPWLERLCDLTPEQLQVLKDAIAAVERAGKEVEAADSGADYGEPA